MSWFKMHLNLSLFFAWLLANFLALIAFALLGSGEITAGWITLLALAAIVMLGTEIWYLMQKRRSLFFLFLNLLSWVGFVILLSLENKAVKRATLENEVTAEKLELHLERTGEIREAEEPRLQPVTTKVEQVDDKPELRQCPACSKESLYWNNNVQLHECVNVACKRRFTEAELTLARQGKLKIPSEPRRTVSYRPGKHMDVICALCNTHFFSIETAREHRWQCNRTSRGEAIHWLPAMANELSHKQWDELVYLINERSTSESNLTFLPLVVREWLLPLMFIFVSSSTGIVISLGIGNPAPFWLLFTVVLVFSVEKWFFLYTRRYVAIGVFYRILLNLSMLSLLALLLWFGIQLFSRKLSFDPLSGSLLLLAELGFFVWLWTVVSRNSWRWPSMKLTVFCLVIMILVFAFAGVEPISSYKDLALTKLSSILWHK